MKYRVPRVGHKLHSHAESTCSCKGQADPKEGSETIANAASVGMHSVTVSGQAV